MRLERTDEFLGYYDYTQDVLRVRFGFQPTRALRHLARRRSRAATTTRARSRSTWRRAALASSRRSGSSLEAEYRVTPRFALWAELDSLDVTSTDARAAYLRTQAMLGVEWRK